MEAPSRWFTKIDNASDPDDKGFIKGAIYAVLHAWLDLISKNALSLC